MQLPLQKSQIRSGIQIAAMSLSDVHAFRVFHEDIVTGLKCTALHAISVCVARGSEAWKLHDCLSTSTSVTLHIWLSTNGNADRCR